MNTPRALIDATGTVVWRWTGEAFGNSPAEEDPDADSVNVAYNLRFAGQYYDRETNTFYNGARDYDPAIGRYLQSDPIGLAGGINTYAYVGDSPLKYIDADGRMPLLLGAALYYAVVYAEELTVATVVTAEIASGVPIPDLSLVSAASSVVRASRTSAQTCDILTKDSAPETLFHFTQSRNADAIAEIGLRRGANGKVFTTPQGNLSSLQAQIDLALPPNRGLPDAVFELNVDKLRQLGIDIPALTQVGRSFNLPGGGLEVPIARDVPPEALRRVR